MPPGTGSTLNYSFDASSNLTTLPTGGTGTYDNAGELTSATLSGTTTAYAYNADGQRLTSMRGSTTSSSAAWNGARQVTSYSDPAATMTAATYDGNRKCVTATTASGTQSFIWNTVVPIPQLLMDSSNAYIFTTSLAPCEQVNLSSGTVTYLVGDLLGSVRGTVNSSGALTGTSAYEAWGNPGTTGGLSAVTPFGFAGGYTDPTGLIYLLARYYDPGTGQLISVDPAIAQSNAAYNYAGGNPVSEVDPNGNVHFRTHHSEFLDIPDGVDIDSYWNKTETNFIAKHLIGLKNFIIVAFAIACAFGVVEEIVCAALDEILNIYADYIHEVAHYVSTYFPKHCLLVTFYVDTNVVAGMYMAGSRGIPS